MSIFKKTTHLSEIIEESEKNSVTIFIHSNDCNSSSRVETEIIEKLEKSALKPTIYMVTVQT
ncbi:monothiol bacilliredoxin BrxC family protein, partial [Brachyspira hyodysenteriae]|uniref:monothiol bacilliredoxin BrxC family protein n=1 Tax=Brachyspira hyodysenteriae TaxID=159 RepID=UPI0011777557